MAAVAHEIETDRMYVPGDDDFQEGEEYLASVQLASLGAKLIEQYPEISYLSEYRINYTWRREGGTSGGKAVLGKCTVLSGYTRYLSEADFHVTLSADHCRDFGLATRQIEALLFHELLHATFDPKSLKPRLRPHDIEMFLPEVQHYGLWTSDLKDAGDVFRQAELPTGVVPFGVKQ